MSQRGDTYTTTVQLLLTIFYKMEKFKNLLKNIKFETQPLKRYNKILQIDHVISASFISQHITKTISRQPS